MLFRSPPKYIRQSHNPYSVHKHNPNNNPIELKIEQTNKEITDLEKTLKAQNVEIGAIIKKETLKNLPYGMNSTGNYTPYWIKDGIKESFICNLVERSIFGHKEINHKDQKSLKDF